MKTLVFISKSRLSQNLLGLLVPLVPTKLSYITFDSLADAAKANFVKPAHLIIFDRNVLPETLSTNDFVFADKPNLKKATRILIHSRHADTDDTDLTPGDFAHCYVKPFLAEELVGIMKDNLA
jgi:hypothetical protein